MAKSSILDIIIGLKDNASAGIKKLEDTFHAGIERMKTAALVLAGGALAGLAASFWQLTKAVKEFAGQELGEVAMESALKQMGQYTDAYKQKLSDLSNQYQKLTGIGDEMWLKAAGQLTRFGMTSKNVDQVFKALSNLTGLMDGNFDGAVMSMQRALEGEFGMFGRLGIKFEETGDKVADLNRLMDLLAEKGAGALEARAQTLSGKWTTLQNAISDFREEVGRTLTESLGLKDGLGWLTEKFDALAESAKAGRLHDILTNAGTAVQNWAKDIADVVDQIHSVEDLKIVAGVIGERFVDFVVGAGKKIGKAIADGMVEAIPGGGLLKKIGEGINTAYGYTPVGAALNTIDKANNLPNRTTWVEEANSRLQASKTPIEISAASQQALADKINKTSDKDKLIRIQIPDGEFIGDAKGLQEFIDNLRETDSALADMLQQTLDTQGTAQKVQEETSKSLKSVEESHTNVQQTMRSASAAAVATSQVATQTVAVTQQVVASQAIQAGQLSAMRAEIGRINSKLRSMNA
jgi:hypothetical protein